MRHGRRGRGLRRMFIGFVLGAGLATSGSLFLIGKQVSDLENRLSVVENQSGKTPAKLRVSSPDIPIRTPDQTMVADKMAPAIEVSGWFIDQIAGGEKAVYSVQPQIRNTTGRDIQMVQAFLLFRTLTGDVICAMDLTQNMTIPANTSVMEPQSHRVGWERLKMLNMTELRSTDIVADLQIEKVVFAN